MEVVKIETKNGNVDLAIYDDHEKDYSEDLCKTEDYGKIVDLLNEQKKNK